MAFRPLKLARKAAQTLVSLQLPAALTMSFVLAAADVSLLPPAVQAQDLKDTGESQFGVSRTLFATLAAINAAGYDAGIDSALNEPLPLAHRDPRDSR